MIMQAVYKIGIFKTLVLLALIASGFISCGGGTIGTGGGPAALLSRVEGTVTNQTNTPISGCLLYTSPSPRDATLSRMPSSA